MNKYYSVSELAKIGGITERTVYKRLNKNEQMKDKFRTVQNGRVFYKEGILPIIGVATKEVVKTVVPSSVDMKKKVQELEKAIEMLNFQISKNYEEINTLKEDKKYFQELSKQHLKTIENQNRTIEQSLTLNYIDKTKDDE